MFFTVLQAVGLQTPVCGGVIPNAGVNIAPYQKPLDARRADINISGHDLVFGKSRVMSPIRLGRRWCATRRAFCAQQTAN